MSQLPTVIRLKQSADTQIVIDEFLSDPGGEPITIGLQESDVVEVQFRETPLGPILAALRSPRHARAYPASHPDGEHIVLNLFGEETRLWPLSVLGGDPKAYTPQYDEAGDLVLPEQPLYATPVVTDANGADRGLSEMDLRFVMEISITRGPLPEAPDA